MYMYTIFFDCLYHAKVKRLSFDIHEHEYPRKIPGGLVPNTCSLWVFQSDMFK